MPTLEFKGKQHIYAHHLTVPYRPLVADPGRSLNPAETDGNLIIRGDNLHALKALLPRYAVGHDDGLAPFAGQVEQRKWLEDIKDHIADSVSIEPADPQYAPPLPPRRHRPRPRPLGRWANPAAGGAEPGAGGVGQACGYYSGRRVRRVGMADAEIAFQVRESPEGGYEARGISLR